jgi:hypothetical protein
MHSVRPRKFDASKFKDAAAVMQACQWICQRQALYLLKQAGTFQRNPNLFRKDGKDRQIRFSKAFAPDP